MYNTYSEWPGELFVNIDSFKGKSFNGYQIGNKGTLLSFKKRGTSQFFYEEPKEMTAWRDSDGYWVANLRYDEGRSNVSIARLVATHFIPAIAGKDFVLHSDGDKDNNCVTNLRWGTAQENSEDKFMHGTAYIPTKFAQKKLTTNEVLDIRYQHSAGYSVKGLASRYNTSRTNVLSIIRRDTWRYV